LTNRSAVEAIGLSSQNPFLPVDEKASLQDAIDLLVRWNVRRIPVVNSEGELVTLLTQSQLISFLQKHISGFPICTKKISELSVGTKEVVSAHMSDKTIDAFKKIVDKGVQGIAVLDEQDKLVGNLSANDLKIIGHTAKLLPLLILPLSHFNTYIPNNPIIPGPIAVNPLHTIEEVMFKIVMSKVHRVFVQDGDRLTGVISLFDLLKLFTS